MKILVVDDSIVYRTAINQALSEVPGYNVFKTCSNGKIAVDFLKQNPDTDLITLDMEMPVMDGMETIKEIRKFNSKVVIIVFSAITTRGAERTIDALSSGADDFVTKIEGQGTIESSIEMIRDELVPKIEALKSKRATAPISPEQTSLAPIKPKGVPEASSTMSDVVSTMNVKPKLVLIGCSTGGPEALTKIFKGITERPSYPMLIVQHMPPLFTKKLAEMLDKVSPVDVREAAGGEKLENGVCYIAPGDYHMKLEKDLSLSLNQDEKVCFVRPAVDVLFQSVSENFSNQVMSIILTGMGEDGANGCEALKEKQAYQFIQDEGSSVVWGMPGAVNRRNIGAKILNLEDFGPLLTEIAKRI
ncbi:chemotaxis-specific protein-glutamate methyltransferase CheB [Bacteriovorax sp. DB6_IX]|uniref:chemotaxis-specific protein-glutamate methyltransferase CheB n=1 Tax=Bacteriovorax sp. DB6_IX TaxID=1353530 RepID=UPI00038A0865|nr:chemotaxis-specific protein-glutamate methyltransferase CheB [Bacteriovorax sp. DB6_IX]EQC49756.1 protein-glutamate methylesterase CheB [Bacteriovorax sp. DB6_IX]